MSSIKMWNHTENGFGKSFINFRNFESINIMIKVLSKRGKT